jgi:hypothetical protein
MNKETLVDSVVCYRCGARSIPIDWYPQVQVGLNQIAIYFHNVSIVDESCRFGMRLKVG